MGSLRAPGLAADPAGDLYATGSNRVTQYSSDADADGVFDSADNCPSAANPGQGNTDADAQGDACDADDDGDGVADGSDACPVGAARGSRR